ncbi:N-acetylgalactosamine 6-sulfate sulfatase [Saccharobesus litoralis]|uniref:N-acetylgalactosamine 6-sulfate sulfatase n=1 Tax=Saccharobesus litoralis TaxID=2172099 RepID=A0A2S0VTI7_9ALTE|nr:sulfatase-like hydrolase/transferase [Saccharobesus litoralis]AWB67538.1 N-acetylgalactosamine 6-sulfate sulfatase [Saccharobesus litoralis]
MYQLHKVSFLAQSKAIGLSVILAGQVFLTGCQPDSQQAKVEAEAEAEAISTPNILFIYTDDQAPWAMGAAGNNQAFTPNMDKLAKQGMRLPNAYTTTPVCSPSRAGLMTSRYGYELGIDDWINTHYGKFGLNPLEPELGLDPNLETWPEVLQRAGYYTGLIGKWHLGITDQHHPTQQGYSEFNGFRSGGTTPQNPKLEIAGQEVKEQGLTADVLTQYAIKFLNENKDRKFALSLHYRAPHTRWLPVAPEDEAPYKNLDLTIPNPDYPNLDVKRVKRYMAEYLSSVRSVDRNLGLILQQLDTLGLSDNTLVIFTSDHGYNMGHNGIWHKGNGHWILKDKVAAKSHNLPADQRPNMYDNSIKVPTIVRWPNKIAANSVNLSSVSNLDWFPTLVAAANTQASQQTIIRGNNVLPVLTGKKALSSSDYYAAYTTKHQSISGMRMYSDGQYKLVKDYINKGRDEFYDLGNDPQESTNLINTNNPKLQVIINRFDDVIFEKMLATQDPLLDQFFAEKKK